MSSTEEWLQVEEIREEVTPVVVKHPVVRFEPGLSTVSLHEDHLGLRELLVEDVPDGACWLVNNNINITVHLSEDFLSDVSVKESQVVVQVILQVFLEIMDIVSKVRQSVCHGLGPCLGEPSTDDFHSYNVDSLEFRVQSATRYT